MHVVIKEDHQTCL